MGFNQPDMDESLEEFALIDINIIYRKLMVLYHDFMVLIFWLKTTDHKLLFTSCFRS